MLIHLLSVGFAEEENKTTATPPEETKKEEVVKEEAKADTTAEEAKTDEPAAPEAAPEVAPAPEATPAPEGEKAPAKKKYHRKPGGMKAHKHSPVKKHADEATAKLQQGVAQVNHEPCECPAKVETTDCPAATPAEAPAE